MTTIKREKYGDRELRLKKVLERELDVVDLAQVNGGREKGGTASTRYCTF